MSVSNPPKALLFDVFGTVVDVRTTLVNALTTAASDKLNSASASVPSAVRIQASKTSWDALVSKWNETYLQLAQTDDPSTPFITVSQSLHTSLLQLLEAENLGGLWTAEEVLTLSRKWHFLDPWPDAPRGIKALNQKFPTCTLSNGDTELLTDMAAHAKLAWTRIFSAEDFQAYKPSPLVYEGAAKALGLRTSECALVAAHLEDLAGAKKCGYQTIYVEREDQDLGPRDKVEEARREGWVDMWVGLGDGGDEGAFLEVARRFGIERS